MREKASLLAGDIGWNLISAVKESRDRQTALNDEVEAIEVYVLSVNESAPLRSKVPIRMTDLFGVGIIHRFCFGCMESLFLALKLFWNV